MVTLTEAPLPYRLVRSRRRSVAIHVHDGEVEVRAPMRTPVYWIEAFVHSKQDWIHQRLAAEQQRAAEALRIAHGERLPFLGEPRELQFVTAARNEVLLDNDTLVIQGRALDEVRAQKLLKAWLTEQARHFLVPRTTALAQSLGVGHKLKEVHFRHTRSKWGHCTTRGVVQFNPAIMMTPEPVVNYLVAHEVCHLLHMNHSAAYWEKVASVCPDHAEQRRWLRSNEHRLRF